jgi:hypothetical protein
VTTQDEVHSPPPVGVERRAQPPQEGDSPQNIVNGFLQAMTAFPVNIQITRSFLAAGEQDAWDPSRRIITYDGPYNPKGVSKVTVRLDDAHWIDARGTWRGRRGNGRPELRFSLVQENDEWRIASAPDAFIVPTDWFQNHYRSASVYYLDPTATILVPEPVFVPDDQLASGLVRALVGGPGPRLVDVSRSFVPPGLKLALSVPVDQEGVASINLDGDAERLTPEAAKLLVYQFAWTLRQAPGLTGFRISIRDEPVTLADGSSHFSIELGSEYDPNDVQASSLLFAVRDGMLESGESLETQPVNGPFGTLGGIESVAVGLKAQLAAAVTGDGTSLLLGSVNDDSRPVTQVVSGASELLKPSWDFGRRVWLVDRTTRGARVSYIDTTRGLTPHPVTIPGISGLRVKRFIVSRDGTRLVAVVQGRSADQLRVSRIRHSTQGRVLGATASRSLTWSGGDTQRIRDIGWRSPTRVAVLHLLTQQVSQVVSVSVDGAGGPQDSLAQQDPAQALVSSPVSDETLYTWSPGRLVDPTGGSGGPQSLDQDVTSVQYVG